MASEDGKLIKALEWALMAEPAAYIERASGRRRARPNATPRQLAERVVESYARKGALEGFVTGLPANPIIAAGGALADVAVLLRFYATMTAEIGYLANERYFDDPDWRNEAMLMMAGPKVVSQALGKVAAEGGKQLTKAMIKKYLRGEALKVLKKLLLRWLGKKITQRAILAKSIPLAGAGIGAVWNYAEVRIIGGRILRYQFEETLS